MKAKIVIAICVVALAAYTLYNNFGRVPPSDESEVRTSFKNFSTSLNTGIMLMTQAYIAPNFSDAKISNEDFQKVIGLKRKYTAKINDVKIQGDIALVSYSRTEIRGEDGDPINMNITSETWVKDKTKIGTWKLQKLADGDTWFRTFEIPKKKVAVTVAQKKEGGVLGTLEKGATVTSMKKGDRYNATGKRDPFRALIAIGATEAEALAGDLCEPNRPREELEKTDLDALKLTGIIQSEGGPLALIETPDGKGYTVQMNMFLGKRCGKVSEIQGDYVLLKEKIRKPGGMPGQFTTIDTPMQLRREEG
jgi:Tfp pilus assembly protein PilP